MPKNVSGSVLQWIAFIALFAVAVLFALGFLASLGVPVPGMGVLNLIKNVLVVVALGLAAHDFAKRLGTVWYVIFWVAVGIALASAIGLSIHVITVG